MFNVGSLDALAAAPTDGMKAGGIGPGEVISSGSPTAGAATGDHIS